MNADVPRHFLGGDFLDTRFVRKFPAPQPRILELFNNKKVEHEVDPGGDLAVGFEKGLRRVSPFPDSQQPRSLSKPTQVAFRSEASSFT